MGAVVPLPRNEQENDDLYALWETYVPALGYSIYQEYLVLGMDDLNHEGQWQDWTGSAVKYTNWYTGHPDRISGLSVKDHALMLGSHFGTPAKQWIAFYNNTKAHVICQLANCTIDDIVLECSPSNIALSIPKCFLDDKEIDASEIYIGETIAESSGDGDACQG